jgi:S-DNA-T family DNA segregation ATPase FtsK/SpoIIIE
MHARKTEFAGQLRSVPISPQHPLELLEFDEIGALTKYIDRKTREAITERVALLTTQGRALGFTVRGYVQEPTKDTVPVRELFPRRICLRVSAKSHVGMVLGDQAYERGAWANRITETEAGVGYVFGEGIREPCASGPGGCPTRRSSNSKRSSPARLPTTQPCCPSPPNPPTPAGQLTEARHDDHR